MEQLNAQPATPGLTIRPFREADRRAVVALWEDCGLTVPWNDPHRDIDRKLTRDSALIFVAERGGDLVGVCMAGYEGHRGSLYYLGVAPAAQRAGVGRALVRHVETALHALGCPKINLMVRTTNADVIRFYEKIGYHLEPVSVVGKRLIEDRSPETANPGKSLAGSLP